MQIVADLSADKFVVGRQISEHADTENNQLLITIDLSVDMLRRLVNPWICGCEHSFTALIQANRRLDYNWVRL